MYNVKIWRIQKCTMLEFEKFKNVQCLNLKIQKCTMLKYILLTEVWKGTQCKCQNTMVTQPTMCIS